MAGLSTIALVAAQEQDQPAQPATTAQSSATRATVHGVVKNAATGEPLARALVQIEGDAETGTLTDGEGHFEIDGVPTGPQSLRVVKPGYRDRPYAAEESGLQWEGPAHSVMVTQQMPELSFALTPNAAIRGHIDLSTGDPAAGITVTLFKQVVRFGRAVWSEETTATANGDGMYRFGNLPEGVYALSTQPVLESEPAVSVVAAGSGQKVQRYGYPSVFYPDAREFAGAGLIHLSAGSQADANFTLTLEPFYPVSIFAGAQSSGCERSGPCSFTATVMDASGHALPYTAQFDDATHSLQADLPDGNYTMTVRGSMQPSLTETGQRGPRDNTVTGTVQFAVSGHPVPNLRVPLAPPPLNVVHLRYLHSANARAATGPSGSGGDLVNLSIDLADSVPTSGNDTVWTMRNDPDAVVFTARPGSYWVTAFLQRRNVCAGSFTAGGANVAREPLVLSANAAPPPMEFDLRDDCGTLALSLPPALSSFEAGEEAFYIVYVVPDFDTVQDIPPMTMHPSSGPTLSIDGLTPGSYHVYTFDSPVHLEYRNPSALAALSMQGQQVTVGAGATTNLALEAPQH